MMDWGKLTRYIVIVLVSVVREVTVVVLKPDQRTSTFSVRGDLHLYRCTAADALGSRSPLYRTQRLGDSRSWSSTRQRPRLRGRGGLGTGNWDRRYSYSCAVDAAAGY